MPRLGVLLLVHAMVGCDPAAPDTAASTVTPRSENAATEVRFAAGGGLVCLRW